jgi:hypothetical protein
MALCQKILLEEWLLRWKSPVDSSRHYPSELWVIVGIMAARELMSVEGSAFINPVWLMKQGSRTREAYKAPDGSLL